MPIKPLLACDIDEFLRRFGNFKDVNFNFINILSQSNIELQFSTQDKSREFDWIDIKLILSGVMEANLVDQNKLAMVDMDGGISIIKEQEGFVLCIGQYSTIRMVKSSSIYIIFKSIKYQELPFSQ